MNETLNKKMILAVLLFFVYSALYAEGKTTELSFLKGLKTREISITALSSLGGYMGKCLSISLHNNTSNPLTIKMDPALIFIPANPVYQNLVAIGEEEIMIPPGAIKTTSLQTFCGKATAHSPARNINYSFWKQGEPAFVKASIYIQRHGLYDDLGQHAIWMFTNNHNLNNVYSYGKNEVKSKDFVKYLANITHQKVPEYYNYHRINTGSNRGPVYEKRISKVFVKLEWSGEFRRNTHVIILDENRNQYKTIDSGEVIDSKGQHQITIMLDPKELKKGIYYIQLKDDENKVWIEKRAVLEES